MSISSSQTFRPQHQKVQSIEKFPNGFQIRKYFERYIRTEYTLAGGLMINLFLMINYSQFKMQNSPRKQWFLQAGFYFTLFCIILLAAKLYAQYNYRVIQAEPVSFSKTILKLLLKTLILLLRPYPFFEGSQVQIQLDKGMGEHIQYHPVNDILSILGLAQSLMIFQMIFNTSKLKNDRSERICQMCGMQASNMYIVRAWFKRKYILRLFVIFLIWSLICTECLRIAQYIYNPKVKSLQNAFWLTFSTMFSIGFGDLFPQTNLGNWIAFITMYSGLVFTYFLIAEIQNFLRLNSHQRRALTLSITLQKKRQLKLAATQFLRQSLWRVWKNYKGKDFNVSIKPTLKEIQLRKRMKNMRIQTRNFRGLETFYNQFQNHFERAQGNIDNLIYNNDQLVNGFLDSINGREITRIMSKRGTFTEANEGDTLMSPKIIETIPTLQSFKKLKD